MDGRYDFEDCIGLKVRPRRGDGLLFYSLLPNGTIDQVSVFFFPNIVVIILNLFSKAEREMWRLVNGG